MSCHVMSFMHNILMHNILTFILHRHGAYRHHPSSLLTWCMSTPFFTFIGMVPVDTILHLYGARRHHPSSSSAWCPSTPSFTFIGMVPIDTILHLHRPSPSSAWCLSTPSFTFLHNMHILFTCERDHPQHNAPLI